MDLSFRLNHRRAAALGLLALGLGLAGCTAAPATTPAAEPTPESAVPGSDAGRAAGGTLGPAAAPIEAKLTVKARPHEPHWVEVDASGTVDPDGRAVAYTFWVSNEAGQTVRSPRETNDPIHGYSLPPGKYLVHVRVTDRDGVETEAEDDVEISAQDVVLSEHGTPCSIGSDGVFSCTMASSNAQDARSLRPAGALDSLAAALLRPFIAGTVHAQTPFGTETTNVSSGTTEDLSSLFKAYQDALKSQAPTGDITKDDPVWIEAFGANGGDGGSPLGIKGGDGADGGQALTVTSINAFQAEFGTDTIAYYLGDNGSHDKNSCDCGGDGGASTIVRAGPAAPESSLADVMVLIAGGGGGAGQGSTDGKGQDGGPGGCALASTAGGAAVTGAGSRGFGDAYGEGGNGTTGGKGGQADYGSHCGTSKSGKGGFGGEGGKGSKATRLWTNGTPGDLNALDDALLSDGAGGASDQCGGGGGGGYGGGGGSGNRSGGGGGGSYAIGAKVSDSTVPTTCSTSGSAEGVVRITFKSYK